VLENLFSMLSGFFGLTAPDDPNTIVPLGELRQRASLFSLILQRERRWKISAFTLDEFGKNMCQRAYDPPEGAEFSRRSLKALRAHPHR